MISVFNKIANLMKLSMVIIFFFPSLHSYPPPAEVMAGETSRGQQFCYRKSLMFKNGEECDNLENKDPRNSSICNCGSSSVHVAMTLDHHFFRGTIAAIHSVLQHSSCPENVFFHFIFMDSGNLQLIIRHVFPSLRFKSYYFDSEVVKEKISPSVREALEQPLNYARNYLGDLLEPCVERVIYLDSDLVLVDDIFKLWSTNLSSRTLGSPEYCHVNFTKYFTPKFWSDSEKAFSNVFNGRTPCYFNTGVMVIDLVLWRKHGYTTKIERWMEVQRKYRIYELGSLPPFLLVFAGKIAGIDHRWNQHGLGGDNLTGNCREMHAGPVSLLHWSGKGKPWIRLDSNMPCPLDIVWSHYDLCPTINKERK